MWLRNSLDDHDDWWNEQWCDLQAEDGCDEHRKVYTPTRPHHRPLPVPVQKRKPKCWEDGEGGWCGSLDSMVDGALMEPQGSSDGSPLAVLGLYLQYCVYCTPYLRSFRSGEKLAFTKSERSAPVS
jgi:hypothetical protein